MNGDKTDEHVSDDVVAQMREVATEKLGAGRVNDAESVALARELIARGEPAPAVRRSESHEEVLKALARRAEDPTCDVTDIVDAAVHTALQDGEIFEAMWRDETDRPAQDIVDELMFDMTNPSDVRDQIRQVVDKDTWLARSLQSAAIHRWLDQGAEHAGSSHAHSNSVIAHAPGTSSGSSNSHPADAPEVEKADQQPEGEVADEQHQ